MKEQLHVITSNLRSMLAAVLLVSVAFAARGDTATGSYILSFGTNVYLWDFSGSYTDDFGNVPLEYTISMDPGGKLTGTGTGTFEDGADHLDFTVSLTGATKTAGKVVRISLNIKMVGSGQVEGYNATFSATAKENFELDPINLQLIGTARGKATVAVVGLGKRSAAIPSTDVEVAVPSGMTGTWDLTLDVSTNKTAYSGDAAVQLSSGRSFPLLVKGSYASKSDASKLVLKGTGLSSAISLALSASVTNAQMTLHKLNGIALGQTLKAPPAP